MSVERYLSRIGYRGYRNPTFGVLARLHRRHLLSVPFENLDIYVGKPIVLDQKSFYQKIVVNRRGGYCYELNGAFSWLLRRLGFRVSMLSARVAGKDGSFSPEYDHMALLVQLGGRLLVDVGFGDSFTEPKQIDKAELQNDRGYGYKVTGEGVRRVVARKNSESSSWIPHYEFTLRPRKLSDFSARNHYQQTSPDSHFTQGRLISRLTPLGRVTLTDRRLVLTQSGERVERSVRNQTEFDELLAKYFRLKLPKGDLREKSPRYE